MFAPMQKKVAFALYFLRMESTCGVTSGTGPSSNVRNIFLPLSGIFQMAEGYKLLSRKFALVKYIRTEFFYNCINNN